MTGSNAFALTGRDCTNTGGLKHQTQPLMGATRLASEKYAAIFSRVRISLLFSIPTLDASPPLVLAFFKQSICPTNKTELQHHAVAPSKLLIIILISRISLLLSAHIRAIKVPTPCCRSQGRCPCSHASPCCPVPYRQIPLGLGGRRFAP